MPTINFEKWHGIGNDFVLIDNRKQKLSIDKEFIVYLGNRRKGIGFDQLILLDYSHKDNCDIAYQFFNPDGSEAEQCGNGQRCISQYLHEQTPQQKQFTVFGLAGVIYSEILTKTLKDTQIKVNMGQVAALVVKTMDNKEFYQVDFGNPHLVYLHTDVDTCNLTEFYQKYSKHYPQGINLEIAEIISPSAIKLRVYERGTGETLACGSGACAAVYALQKQGHLDTIVKVTLPGGNLVVEYTQQTHNLYLTGSATYVFSGEITV
ncbi:MAG: diaminopimelate epimerase [Proteobacteria bacterium]|nr:diaminopimelate epimerase [Pseudomonadota bacterium]